MSVLAVAVGINMIAPTAAMAGPAPKPQAPDAVHVAGSTVPMVPEGVSADALAALVPAILGAVATHAAAHGIASAGQQGLLEQAQGILNNAGLPPQVRQSLQGIITFLDGTGGGGPALPSGGPQVTQFLYPSLGRGCILTGDSVGTAMAVPGPADLPLPGPESGQTAFVMTALGTSAATDQQNPAMIVQWLNLDTQQSGTVPLTDDLHINPLGPATLSAIADTGRGRVAAVISGSLTTQPIADQPPITCSFLPTMGFFVVN